MFRRRRRCPSMPVCRHSLSLPDGPVPNKQRCFEATLSHRNHDDDGSTCFDPGLYPKPSTTPAPTGVQLNPPHQTTNPSYHQCPTPPYDFSLPTNNKRQLLAHLPCGCRAYADDADLVSCRTGLWPGALTRTWCRSIEALTGGDTTASTKKQQHIGLYSSSTPPASRRHLNCQLDPSVIRSAVTGQSSPQEVPPEGQQRPRSMPEGARADEVKPWKGDDNLPQVVTECRPLISAAAALTRGCLYQSPSSLTYGVSTLPANPPPKALKMAT